MGANHHMYAGPWRSSLDFDFRDWPSASAPESIVDLAAIIAEQLDYQPDAIVGSSLGGMVALELASLMGVRDVALLGSAVSHQEVNGLLQLLSPLAGVTPLQLCQTLAGKTPGLLLQMYSEQDPEFIRAMIRSVFRWSYEGDAAIFRIHGRHDPVIQCEQADVWLDAGHLVAMTHAEDCVSALVRWPHA